MIKYLKKIKQFHGHIGPYVVLGYLMGIYVKSYLDKVHEIVIYINPRPPVSCIIDGLQLSTGCTLGRNKIRIQTSQWFNKVIFYSLNKKIELTLGPAVIKKLKSSLKNALCYIKKTPKNQLFIINKH